MKSVLTPQNQGYIVIETLDSILVNRPSQKVLATKIMATDFTDALLEFKRLRKLDRLPYETMIIDAENINHYPKNV